MALMDLIKKSVEKPVEKPTDANKLNPQELQLILQILRQSTVKGDQVECFYNMVIKLQNQFLEQAEQ